MLEAIKQATVAVEYATEALLSADMAHNAAAHDLAQACADFLVVYCKLAPNAKRRLQGAERSTE